MPVTTPAERSAALKGFVYAPVRVHDLLDAQIGMRVPAFRFKLVDRSGTGDDDTILYERNGAGSVDHASGAAVLSGERAIAFGGRVWSVSAQAPATYGAIEAGRHEAGVLGGGAALTFLLACLVWMLLHRRDRAETLAAAITGDLEASHRRVERIVEGTTDGTWDYDVASRTCALSARFCEILGLGRVKRTECYSWVLRRVHPDERAAATRAFRACGTGAKGFDQRMRMRIESGSYRWVRVRGGWFEDAARPMLAGSMSDVHDEQEAGLREARLLKVIEMSPDLFMTFDLEGHATYLNAAARAVFGSPSSDILAGFSLKAIFAQNDVARACNESVPTACKHDHWEGETELITISGQVLPVHQVILSHKGEAGQVEFYSTVMRDVSERRATMNALQQAQERLQRALDGSSDGIWERDVHSDAFSTSDRLAQMLGYEPVEMPRTRLAWRALNHPDDMPVSDASVARLMQSTETVVWETRMRMRSGTYRWMRRRGRTVFDAAGAPVVTAGTLTDIHDAKVAEIELKELKTRYQRALDGSKDGIWEMDEVTEIFECSGRFCEILGWNAQQQPRTRAAMQALLHPEDLAAHAAAVARMRATTSAQSWDVRLRRGNGEYQWMRYRGIASHDAFGKLTLTSGTVSDIHQARLAEDELRRHRDDLAGLVRDRTLGLENAHAEAEASRETAERANLAKSEFLANMSHELRTPMHAIISFANFGVDKAARAERDKLQHYFVNIQRSGSRLLALLNDLLDLSKMEAGRMEMALAPVDAAVLLGDAVVESEAFAQTCGVRLHLDADAENLTALWDGPRILQVIRNLISNAVKFSLEDSCVVLSARPVLMPVGRRASDPRAQGIEIRVQDAGVGIPEDELETVFDKFVQSSKTKTGAGGTGLGLAICREIVTAHQGRIWAENNQAPATGAVFVVMLPVTPVSLQQLSHGNAGVETAAAEIVQ